MLSLLNKISSENKAIRKQKRLNIKLETKYKIIQSIDKKTLVSEMLETFKDEKRRDYSIKYINNNYCKQTTVY